MKRYSARLAAILLVAGSFVAGDALLAQSTAKKMEPATAQQADKASSDLTQLAKDGQAAVRAMHAARVAIFNGEPEIAKKALADAKKFLEKAKADEAAAGMKGDMIPIDGSLALTDTFVESPECKSCIAKANELFSAGNKDKALEELRLGEIEVDFSRVLMPVAKTEKQLMTAIDFANSGKFYECNLALKAAEDGLQIDSVSLVEIPGMEPAKARTELDKANDKTDGSGKK